jgi:hypothetical protein
MARKRTAKNTGAPPKKAGRRSRSQVLFLALSLYAFMAIVLLLGGVKFGTVALFIAFMLLLTGLFWERR